MTLHVLQGLTHWLHRSITSKTQSHEGKIRQVVVDDKDDHDALHHLHRHPEIHPQLKAK